MKLITLLVAEFDSAIGREEKVMNPAYKMKNKIEKEKNLAI